MRVKASCCSKTSRAKIGSYQSPLNILQETHLSKNSIAEVRFATIGNRGRSMMHRANLPMALSYIISHEAFNCATQLDGLVLVTINGVTKTRYEHWVGKNLAFTKYLRTWGEAGTMKVKTKTSPKLKDKGVHCMFVGYVTEHSGDTYRMYDPKTNCIWVSRM